MELLDESIVPEHARALKQEAREFAEAHIAPAAEEYYESGEYPREILEAGMEAGLVAQDISEEYGGKGLDLQQILAISEEFYRADAGIALTLQLASFGCEIMEHYGSEEQKEKWLRPVAENEQISGLAVSEPQTGSDMAGMETTAEKTDDGYVLNGEKYWVGNAVEADWLTVYAKTGDSDDRYSNYSMFVVPTDTPGYEAEHIPEKMGMRASKQGHIVFDDCEVPEENLIGAEGGGFYMLADFFNHGRVIVGGHSLGLAAAAIEEAWDFVHGRKAFGRNVSEFQAVQHILADMRMEFESARALNWRAAEKVQNGEDTGFWAASAKTKSTEMAVDVAERGMQLHGGRSVLNEYKISRVYRDVRIPVIYEGANEIQRNLIYRQGSL
ncbi:acyl-CoA dehydrogenase [Haloferax mediterranei ATCC 33500]|uniref:Acyl-CoA dehydrogenase n=1 Tax=Haloferax mediterranei (strain ATCC 33500 / DSM 1411 / JCM 8866 / NBRC 14739 / NCIMB 2177 / R-4) TaxID=523841 RepID=I3R4J8_HALMT|nr:acyl-CoA dehydrogenase [Haloferax mediterranei]AFK19158.1 acyl-CoA dehydrogenase [Haloferax mediterranei ATCC 33500]AHZ21480.1 acyl-CoA dehydrogenase [Haloferax mediterranei ATCC 33500]EMA03940.1 acyl-CoA dehydrogenase [Haloferax mediterranei ATCC 33500]MDX5989256.1 acyl-CoA dehydrogenase [Haloferax mediterranei ATCC 33500]QCQ75627.1 acyl-CoA dehydrogenase [Haloferax mediterranei ATCC 33500]